MAIQVLVKDDGAPPVPAYMYRTVKVMECRHGCGQKYIVTSRQQKAPGCLSCGIAKAVEVQRQMHAKSGPHYDKWLVAMADPSYHSRYIMGMRLYVERISAA